MYICTPRCCVKVMKIEPLQYLLRCPVLVNMLSIIRYQTITKPVAKVSLASQWFMWISTDIGDDQ